MVPASRPYAGPMLLAEGFRPFFLAAAVWAAVALGLWVALLSGAVVGSTALDPLAWHIHEMLFGFVMAGVAGFILTAIPNWTGRLGLRGMPLAALVGLWLAARALALVSLVSTPPAALTAVVDAGLPLALAVYAARQVVAARNWRNLVMTVPLVVLAVADGLMISEGAGAAVPRGLGWRLGLAAVIILISAIGGRIIPAFTRNWLVKRGADALPPANPGLVDKLALASLHTGLLAWAFLANGRGAAIAGGLLLLASALNLARLARWRGWVTLAEPLLTVLHLGYLWVVVGAALLGGTLLSAAVPAAAAIHALTAGSIGTMMLAVMSRASLGHTGRALTADRTTVGIYLMVNGAALSRIVASLMGGLPMPLLGLSALLWIAAFVLFAGHYTPYWCRPRVTA
ncbi:NnrS family protein [Nitrospirillum sp. BR 11164]|uniref:NnrS family protein n=1 Tax=Nitrospirillum sp. BR 11164 TaxID=3104324 RepID=UPI002AFEF54F|nr:NnrS family protein [Nitrospirillum sp. BR 11164]MEA1648920.1 NnrS family protein [Nitrospirillum sp. BR 11164]